MKNEKALAESWITFLSDVDETRRRLRCSQSPAWFRGHANSEWELKPTLFRGRPLSDPDDAPEDRRRQIEIARLKAIWQEHLERKTFLKKQIQRYQDAINARSRPGRSFDSFDSGDLEKQYHAADLEAGSMKSQMADAKRKLARFRAPVNGERELFDEFIFRASKTAARSSWETVAEMRHFGVPTRLLDWTDRLDIALYFALEKYRTVVEESMSIADAVRAVEPLPAPCIWILNPYLLSRRAAGRTAIWNLALDPQHDYYHLLLRDRAWPYDEPIPTYPPAPMERIRSQRGSFIVFGNLKEALEVQLKNGLKVLGRIVLSPQAGIFCLDYLARVQGLSEFEIFRDLDSLGRELSQRFARIQRPDR